MSDTQIVSGLDAIESLVAKPIVIDFVLKGKKCRINARHLKPWEYEMIRVLSDGVQPKIKYGKTPEEDRFEVYDQDYLKRKAECDIQRRSLSVFWGVDDFQKKCPDLAKKMYDPTAFKEITKAVQAVLMDDVLNIVSGKIMMPDLNVSNEVNFSSPDGSVATQS
jgi:hypothetical protein